MLPAIAALLSIVLHVVVLRLWPRLHLLDFPERYNLRRGRLPYPTGVATIVTFLLLAPWLLPVTVQTAGILTAVVVLGATCFMDDRRPLSPVVRFGVQMCCAIIIFLTGTRLYSLTNPLAIVTGVAVVPLDRGVVISPLLSDPALLGALFTIAWLGVTVNAMNWLDGIPGQVSALSTVGFFTLGALAQSSRVGQPEIATLAFSLAGVSVGSLLFDFPPPRALMGDTGAMFYGLLLGILGIIAGGKVATVFLVLGVPLVDFGIVTLRRVLGGRSPFKGSGAGEHLHHRLLARGWSERGIISLTTVIGAAFGITALFLSTLQKFLAVLLLIILVCVLSTLAGRTSRTGAQAYRA